LLDGELVDRAVPIVRRIPGAGT